MRPSALRSPVVSVVVTNALPIAGVAYLNWSLAALVVVYWIELGATLCFGAVRGLFAQRPPDHPDDLLVLGAFRYKRGGFAVPATDLEIQVANLPVVALAVVGSGAVWLFTGAIAVGSLDEAGFALTDAAAATAGLGIISVVAGRAVGTVTDYFLTGRYREVNVQLAFQSAFWPILVVGLALLFGGIAVEAGAPAGLLLGGLVSTKALFDLAGAYSDRLRAFDERTYLDFGWAYEPPERDAVADDLAEPVTTVRPNPWAVLASGPIRGAKSEGAILAVVVCCLSLLLSLLAFNPVPLLFGGGFALAILLFLAVLGTIDQAIRHLAMEYRVGEDVVGYDRLLGEPQWRLPAWKLERADPERTVTDRLFGTETLDVSHDDRTIRIAHVPDAAVVRSSTDRDGGRSRRRPLG